MSTVVGNLLLSARESDWFSLFDVQSDENFRFKIVKVPETKSLAFDVLDEMIVLY